MIIDSGSSDNSIELLKNYDVRIVTVDPKQYNHGLTRNLGIDETDGDLIFFTVQDAWLSESDNLQKMIDWFLDESIMAVSGHQAVPHDKTMNPILWFRRYNEPIAEVRHWGKGVEMPSFSWDNVNAMYRRSALSELPFEKTDFGEDQIWAFQALNKGWKIVYDPSIVVFHYHHRTFQYVFNIESIMYFTFYKHFNIIPQRPHFVRRNLAMVYHISRNKYLIFREKVYWIYHNLLSNFSVLLAFYLFRLLLLLGYRSILTPIYNKLFKFVPQGKQYQQ